MYHQFTEPERYALSVLKREGRSLRNIAFALQRSPNTISREIRRNCTVAQGKPRPLYVPSKAQEHANGRRSRSQRVKQHGPDVCACIEALLARQQWSPEQIANLFPEHLGVRMRHMTIYRHGRRDQRKGGRLYKQLRQGGKRRRKRTYGPEKRGKRATKPMIDTRPEAVELRQEVGHWEGDTVMGATGERDYLLTLVERSTGLALVIKLPHRTVRAVNRAAHRSSATPNGWCACTRTSATDAVAKTPAWPSRERGGPADGTASDLARPGRWSVSCSCGSHLIVALRRNRWRHKFGCAFIARTSKNRSERSQ